MIDIFFLIFESFLLIAEYSKEEDKHGHDNELCDLELVWEHDGADDCCEHVGCCRTEDDMFLNSDKFYINHTHFIGIIQPVFNCVFIDCDYEKCWNRMI